MFSQADTSSAPRSPRLVHRFVLFFGFVLLVEFAFLGAVWVVLDNLEQRCVEKAETNEVVIQLYRVSNRIVSLFASVAKQVYGLDEYDSDSYKKACEDLPKAVAELKEVYSNRRDADRQIAKLEEVVDESVQLLKPTVDTRISGALDKHHLYTRRLRDNIEVSIGLLEKFLKRETSKREPSGRQFEDKHIPALIALCGVAISLLLGGLSLYAFHVGLIKRIEQIISNSVNYSVGRPLTAPSTRRDEVGSLDRSLHYMIQRLEEISHVEKSIIDSTRDVVFTVSQDGLIVSMNASCRGVWGFEPEELIGSRVSSLVSQDRQEDTIAALQRCMSRGAGEHVETQVPTRSGDVREMRWSLSFNPSNNTVSCTAFDTTEPKKVERLIEINRDLLEAMLAVIPIGVVTFGTDQKVRSMNPAAKEILDCDRAEYLSDLLGGARELSWQDFLEQSAHVTDSRRSVRLTDRESEFRRALDLRISDVSPDGEEKKRMLEITDVTIEQDLESMKKDIMSMISHDLRTPMSSIHFSLDVIADGLYGELPTDLSSELREQSSSVGGIIGLLNDFLLLEKLMENKLKLETIEIDVLEILDGLAEQLEAERKLECKIDGIYKEIVGDEEQTYDAIRRILKRVAFVSTSELTISVGGADQVCTIDICYPGPSLSPGAFDNALRRADAEADSSISKRRSKASEQFVTSGRNIDLSLIVAGEILRKQGWQIVVQDTKNGKSKVTLSLQGTGANREQA